MDLRCRWVSMCSHLVAAARCGVSMNLWRAVSVVSGRYIARCALVRRRYRRCTSIRRVDGRASAPARPARRLDGPRRHGNARLLP